MTNYDTNFEIDGYLDGYGGILVQSDFNVLESEDLIDAGGVINFGTMYFLMRGKDVDCGTLTYRTWVVIGDPDFTGAHYVGSKCGASSLSEIVIAASWTAN